MRNLKLNGFWRCPPQATTQFQMTGSSPAKYKLSYTYNLAGMLTSETYPSGRVMSYAYDDGARLSSASTTVGGNTTTLANAFQYESHGALSSEIWGNGAVHSMTYNK